MIREIVRVGVTLIIILYSVVSFSNNYQEQALEIKNSINVGNITTEDSIKKSVTEYKGVNIDEASYYNSNSRMEIDAQEEFKNNEVSDVVQKVENNRGNFRVDRDEDWLKNATDIESGKSTYNINYIASTYEDCSPNNPICYFEPKNQNNNCEAKRVVKLDNYHKYECSREKYNYDRNCNENLKLSCTESSYSLPHTTYMSFPNYRYHNNILRYITPNRMGHNCSGYNYYWRFNIDSLDNVEEFRFLWGQADDRTLIYINNHLVHNYPHSGCELGRTFHNAPNKDLKPYLKIGNNELRVRIIVGGKGEARGEFKVKYKQCNQYSQNQFIKNCDTKKFTQDKCTQISKVCTDSNKTKHIGSGIYEYKDCWNYEIEESCQISNYENFCNNLDSDQSCHQSNSTCLDNLDNSCRKFQNQYKCSDLKDNRLNDKSNYLGYFQDILEDYIDYSQCDDLSDNQYCNLENEQCQNRGKQNIDGKIIDRDCWVYNMQYSCQSFDINDSNCKSFEENPNCSFINQSCKQEGQNNCIEFQREYQCNNQDQKSDKEEDILFCGNQVYCDNDSCDPIDYQKDQNFNKAASSLSTLNEAGKELSSSLFKTFTGENNQCEKDLINYQDCCSQKGWGDEINSESSCTYHEKNLSEQKEKKLCVHIGNYCSEEIGLTKICSKEKQSYCCFGSKIARIIHEQGRPQLGIGWGDPKYPNCNGLLVEDLQKIDFTKIDFTELSDDMANKAKDNINTDQMKESIINNIEQHYE
jgi:hypothetical protein